MNTFATRVIKSFLIFGISVIGLTSCQKQADCFGDDCIYPEATVEIDSITNNRIYVSLLNSEGNAFTCPLSLSPGLDEKEFMNYTVMKGPVESGMKLNERKLKVTYTATDQSYITTNAQYINAFQTKLEIVAFGEDLILTY